MSRVAFCETTWLCGGTWSPLIGDAGGLKDSCKAIVFPACLCSLWLTLMQMDFIALSLLSFQAALSRVANTMSVRGICSYILQRSMELRWYHWMDRNYECALCRVHVLGDQDEIRSWHMMSPLICILYILIGFHQLILSLFHFPWLSLFFYNPLPFSSICVSSV